MGAYTLYKRSKKDNTLALNLVEFTFTDDADGARIHEQDVKVFSPHQMDQQVLRSEQVNSHEARKLYRGLIAKGYGIFNGPIGDYLYKQAFSEK